MTIALIAAMSENRVIGRGDAIPWHLPKDLRRFRDATMGHPVIMGRKTFETLPAPLPGRTTIVLTTREGYRPEGALVASSLEEGLRLAERVAGGETVYIAGGEAVYRAGLAVADEIRLTIVHTEVEGGDAFFPELDAAAWAAGERERHEPDDRHAHAFTFLTYRRVSDPVRREPRRGR